LSDPAVASDRWARSPLSDIPEFNTRSSSTSKFDKKSEDLRKIIQMSKYYQEGKEKTH
jgi:hypothetical protein